MYIVIVDKNIFALATKHTRNGHCCIQKQFTLYAIIYPTLQYSPSVLHFQG